MADNNFKMPVLFVGHGSPMNAVEDNEFSRAWAEMGRSLPRPEAILCVSAHWETAGTLVSSGERPETIHDFSGFPPALYRLKYPAPGSPALARRVEEMLKKWRVRPDPERGFDHGAWSVLCRMFPKADIPVAQLSLDSLKGSESHYALGRDLAPLRREGVLVVCCGNIVHNLREMSGGDAAYDWAAEFDRKIRGFIAAKDDQSVVHYQDLGALARASAPTPDHFLPLLYALALREGGEEALFFTEKVSMGAISMTSFRFG